MENMLYIVVAAVVVIAAIVALILVSYVKAPPDTAFIITGAGRKKVLIGNAGLCLPLVNRMDKLLLRQVSVDIKTNGYIPTKDFIGVDIDAIAKVAVMSDKEMVKVPDANGDQVYPPGDPMEGKHYRLVPGIDLAMKNFLNMKEDQIVRALTDSLQGNMREIIGTMELRVISSDRKAFGDQVQEKAQSDMNNLGIKIISCNIQKVIDENGLINALGQDNMSKIQKEAAIAKAEAERDVAIKQAETAREANDARVIANLEIAQKNNELALKKADLKKFEDTKAAEADAAYDIQKQIQMKQVNTETVNAQIAQAEREADLRERQVAIKERELEANIRKQAEAERYATEQKAEAELAKRQREAEASQFEQEREAEARKAQADADKFKAEQEAAGVKAKYDAEAAGIQAKGLAEAEAARARGLAEAEAIKAKGLAEAEAMEKRAEAYRKYNSAAIVEMMIKIMPEMASEIAKPLSQIDSINIYGTGDGGSGAAQISGNMPVVMKQVFDTMSQATGVDLSEIIRANTYDAKVTRNVNVTGLAEAKAAASAAAEPEVKAEEVKPDAAKTAVKTGLSAAQKDQ
jgi:flotillin